MKQETGQPGNSWPPPPLCLLRLVLNSEYSWDWVSLSIRSPCCDWFSVHRSWPYFILRQGKMGYSPHIFNIYTPSLRG